MRRRGVGINSRPRDPRTHGDPLSQHIIFIPNILCIAVITSNPRDQPCQGAYPIISACAEDNL